MYLKSRFLGVVCKQYSILKPAYVELEINNKSVIAVKS